MITTDWSSGIGGLTHVAITSLESAGVLVIVFGAVLSVSIFAHRAWRSGLVAAYRPFRATLGRTILMGLEFLVASDILKSLVMPHQLENLLGLAVLMVARTFLSLSLSVEIYGHWPWQETEFERQGLIKAE
jgi:uncharacterized membrane protein